MPSPSTISQIVAQYTTAIDEVKPALSTLEDALEKAKIVAMLWPLLGGYRRRFEALVQEAVSRVERGEYEEAVRELETVCREGLQVVLEGVVGETVEVKRCDERAKLVVEKLSSLRQLSWLLSRIGGPYTLDAVVELVKSIDSIARKVRVAEKSLDEISSVLKVNPYTLLAEVARSTGGGLVEKVEAVASTISTIAQRVRSFKKVLEDVEKQLEECKARSQWACVVLEAEKSVAVRVLAEVGRMLLDGRVGGAMALLEDTTRRLVAALDQTVYVRRLGERIGRLDRDSLELLMRVVRDGRVNLVELPPQQVLKALELCRKGLARCVVELVS